MSGVNTLYVLSQVVLPTGTIHQITDSNLDPGISEMLVGGSGDLDFGYGASAEVKPQLSFSTTACGTALGIAGVNGYAFTGGGAAFYFRPVGVGATRTDTACVKIAAAAGLVVPKSMKASDSSKDPAKIDYDVYFLSSDGVTAPLTTSTGVTLPSVPLASEAFTSGALKLNGAFIPTVNDLSIDFGLKCETQKSDGCAYPSWAGITGNRKVEVSPTIYDMTQLDALGTAGAALNNGLALTAWIVWFKKVASGGTRVANATAGHLKIAGTTGFLRHDKHGGSQGKATTGALKFWGLYDGTNSVATVTNGAAIA